jgi:MFS transporter, AAHS family, 4-hydroxybenzoate transporter
MTMAEDQKSSIGSLIDGAPWGAYQKFVLVLVALAIITDGIATQALGMAVPAIIRDWGATRGDFAVPTALGFVGMALGAYVAGRLGDRIGRRWPLIVSVAIFGGATLLASTVDTIPMLALLRFIDGLGMGGALPNATSLLADITPARKRVLAVSMGVIGMPLGNFLCGLAGAAILPGAGWRMLFIVCGTAALAIALLLILFLPESPRILHRRSTGRPALKRLLSKMGIDAEPESLVSDRSKDAIGTSQLLSNIYRRDTLALWGSYVLTMLAIYTIVSWAPTLIAQQGFDIKVAGIALSAFSAGSILGSFALTMIVARAGSRLPMIITSAGGVIASLYLTFATFSPAQGIALPVIALAVMGFMISGVQNMLYVLAANIYPPHMRASGLGSGLAVGRIGAIASGFTGAISLAQGSTTFFAVLAIVFTLLLGAVLAFANPIPRASVD